MFVCMYAYMQGTEFIRAAAASDSTAYRLSGMLVAKNKYSILMVINTYIYKNKCTHTYIYRLQAYRRAST